MKKSRSTEAKKRPAERLSLAGMDPEDAIRKALSTPPPAPPKKTARKSRGKSGKK